MASNFSGIPPKLWRPFQILISLWETKTLTSFSVLHLLSLNTTENVLCLNISLNSKMLLIELLNDLMCNPYVLCRVEEL